MNPWGSQEQLPTNFREGFDALRKSWVPGSNKFSNSASLGSQNQVDKIKNFLHWRIGKQHIIKTCSFSLDRYGGGGGEVHSWEVGWYTEVSGREGSLAKCSFCFYSLLRESC